MSKVQGVVIGIVIVLVVVAVLAWPVKVVCPNGPCLTGVDEAGYVHRYYEIKPLGADLLSLPFRYSSGNESEQRERPAA